MSASFSVRGAHAHGEGGEGPVVAALANGGCRAGVSGVGGRLEGLAVRWTMIPLPDDHYGSAHTARRVGKVEVRGRKGALGFGFGHAQPPQAGAERRKEREKSGGGSEGGGGRLGLITG